MYFLYINDLFFYRCFFFSFLFLSFFCIHNSKIKLQVLFYFVSLFSYTISILFSFDFIFLIMHKNFFFFEKIFPGKFFFEKQQNKDIYFVADSKSISLCLSYFALSSAVQAKIFIDLCVVDYLNLGAGLKTGFADFFFKKTVRFEMTYQLLSVRFSKRFFIKTYLTDKEFVESVSSIFASANWSEREAWDMFGVFFFNHADLRRILTDYGFFGHPLRKEFPISGFFETQYTVSEKRVISQPVVLNHEFRAFNFENTWFFYKR